MKNISTFIIALLASVSLSKAQQTAMDFTMNDCNGQMHHLFSELDSNNVVIMEFFMLNCNPCVTAGDKMMPMYDMLLNHFPGHVKFYHFPFNNSTSCTDAMAFVMSNGYNTTPFDSGAAQVAYYGGFGMPTVAVVGGSAHDVLYTTVGFSTSDTTAISAAIHEFFMNNPVAINELPAVVNSLSVFPNPAADHVNIEINLKEKAAVTITLLTIKGEQLAIIEDKNAIAGLLQTTFHTAAFATGLYLVKTTVNGTSFYSKLNITQQ